MKKEYNIIFSTIFIFVLSCTNNQLNTNPKTSNSPIPTQTSSVNPNTSGQYTNNQINNINISNNKPCLGQDINISGDSFTENIGNEVKIWIQSPNSDFSQKFPPLYPFASQIGKVNIDSNGRFNFTFKLKDKYISSDSTKEVIIESKKTYIIYIEYGENGGNFKSINIEIC